MTSIHRASGVLFLLSVTAIMTGCASAGPPLPPSLRLPKPPSDLRATRKGNNVELTWTVPTETTDRETLRHQGSTSICRSLEPQISECGVPVGQVSPTNNGNKSAATTKTRAAFTQALAPDLQRNNVLGYATYAVEVLN